MKSINVLSQVLLLAGSLAVATTTAVANEQDLALEPCINGSVSATGRFEIQALEDAALRHGREVAQSDASLGSGEDDVIAAFGGQRDDFDR